MNAILGLLTGQNKNTTQNHIEKFICHIELISNSKLPSNYKQLTQEYYGMCDRPIHSLRQMIRRLKIASNQCQVIKILALIHYILQLGNYQEDLMEILEHTEISQICFKKNNWVQHFIKSYTCYLIKMPMQFDIYHRAKIMTIPSIQQHLTQIYRVINHISILFPHFPSAVNTVGRYYLQKYSFYMQLFENLNNQLLMIYLHLKHIIENFLHNYTKYQKEDLVSFYKSLSQIEIFFDKVQQLIMSKYLKGKKINVKIGFRQEYINQIKYYIDYGNTKPILLEIQNIPEQKKIKKVRFYLPLQKSQIIQEWIDNKKYG